ncbi:hypothetical protein [Mesorhizobium sp. LNJC403B00]|uniref:hypothetical protein n=1 Tax=Mesorhizobium sp. LNJC403B00 TaxID=1287280 RepID=UPI0003CE9ADB|nr:hypothetical protein [Mesorhizobium sp. LNJC403B00]ESX91756.1 hypothetical protein X754_21860 [Mesorhizobium sp. LNJC403B00]
MPKQNETSHSRRSDFANDEPIRPEDAAVLDSPVGHEDRHGAEPGFVGADDVDQPIGARPRSEITGRHDEGAGANDTIDGLSETEELTRSYAEDIPTGDNDEEEEDIPVFERGRSNTEL